MEIAQQSINGILAWLGEPQKNKIASQKKTQRTIMKNTRAVKHARRRPIRPIHRRNRRSNFTFSVGPLFEVVVRRNPRRAVRNQMAIRFKGTSGRQLRHHFVIGEGETAETAVPRQERIRGHRIIFVPT